MVEHYGMRWQLLACTCHELPASEEGDDYWTSAIAHRDSVLPNERLKQDVSTGNHHVVYFWQTVKS